MPLAPLTIQLFGPLRVQVHGAPLPRLRTRSVEWLLALLVLRPDRTVSRSWLAGTLWPESRESQALENLRHDLVSLRKALGPEHVRLRSPARDALTLDLADAEVDVVRFDRLIRTGDEAALRGAVGLYTGPLLEGCYEEWALIEREMRAVQCRGAIETLAGGAQGRGEHAEAVDWWRRARGLDPLRDSIVRGLMESLAAGGDPGAALQAYREFRLRLQQELGAAPEATTTRLFYEIRAAARSASAHGAPPRGSTAPGLAAWQRESHRPRASGDPVSTPPLTPALPPHPLTSLIGREADIRAVSGKVREDRLVTLVGGGGVGKTRLALEVAARAADDFPGGAVWVELASLTDGALIVPAIAAALGLRVEGAGGPETLKDRLVLRLTECPVLLALDNCEHLLDASAEVAQALLSRCPDLRVLATSRQRLGLWGEVAWRVPSLPAPDPEALPAETPAATEAALGYAAVQLFVERAAAVREGFGLASREEVDAVCRICRRLDGIPLAIELAAARVTVLPPDRIASRLDDRFRLLTGGSRGALSRHQTLRALIDWSYDLLTEPEADLLRRLSVFAGGWTLEAAESIVADGSRAYDVLDLLDSLEARSLILVDGSTQGPRYRMLETVREYAREKLHVSGEEAAVRAAHAAHYLNLAEAAKARIDGPEQLPGLDLLEAELPNLRAAMAWCLEPPGDGEVGLRLASAMHYLWIARYHADEGRRYVDALLASQLAAGRTQSRAAALYLLASLALFQGDYSAARARSEESLAICEELGDRRGVARALNRLCSLTSDREQARRLATRSLALFRECGDPTGTASTLTRLSAFAVADQDHDAARILHREALSIARSVGDRMLEAGCLSGLATIEYERRDFAAARRYFQASLTLARELGMHNQAAVSLYFLGLLAFHESDHGSARALWEECREIDRQNRHKGGSVLGALAELDATEGAYGTMCARWEECLAEGRELDRLDLIVRALRGLGDAARLEGDTARALARYAESLQAAQATSGLPENKIADERHPAECAACLRGIAAILGRSGREEPAARLMGTADRLLRGIGAQLSPAAQADREAQVAALRRNLGDEGFETAWQEGQAMTLEQTIDYIRSSGSSPFA